jgi:hypothetical protein
MNGVEFLRLLRHTIRQRVVMLGRMDETVRKLPWNWGEFVPGETYHAEGFQGCSPR